MLGCGIDYMNTLNVLREVVKENRAVRLVEEGIYSVLPDIHQTCHYDNKVAAYDFVVGTRLYNRVMWGSSPNNYVDFARTHMT
jgi:hypothetical protein